MDGLTAVVRPPGRKSSGKARKGARRPAETLKVARVVVDVSLPHLDRPFDYLVPSDLDEKAVPGCRVRVRFAGQLVDGFLLERAEDSDHDGRLSFLERVISPEPVLTPEIAALAREVADRYAGTLSDVLRLAVPPRHARVEAERPPAVARPETAGPNAETPGTDADPAGPDGETADPAAAIGGPVAATAHLDAETVRPDTAIAGPVTEGAGPAAEAVVSDAGTVRPDAATAGPVAEIVASDADGAGVTGDDGLGAWEAYRAGPSFLAALREGRAPRAVWTALPGADWTGAVARAARATLDGGRGVLIVVADGRDVARVDAALGTILQPGRHVALTAELGPAERYRRWLAVLRGEATAVVGTRAAMFAPVRDLGLVVLWDDGDDVHAEPHAPYPHAREVLALRAHRAGAGALIGGFTRTTDATQLLETGWAHPLVPDRDRLRRSMPYVRPAGDDAELARDEAARTARLPHLAFRTARQGLEKGPVLVQVPRRGYVPALACARCRGPARCPECEGPLALTSGHAAPYCRWCGRIAGAWRCPECGSGHVRAVVVGARRTAEELGRAFPGVPIRTSGRDGVLATVGAEPALVVATPGAEPVPAEGYAAALLLDGWVLLGRADLRAGEETLRRWTDAAALVRPGGPVVVLADGALAPVQALIRWDPATFAERELAERRELGFPPAVRMASVTGTPQAVRDLLEAAALPPEAEVLGPVEVGDGQERALVRVDRARGAVLARCLKAAQAARSARKVTEAVRVRIDPLELI
ncbi:primosomal protein N' family DNA-binding protein [Actinoallomurus rhizosphaericola]|uniref:primosomal protein N' family DNA-binding protein n=1 Tax=Actinoallomurus rhizosphaericola TaxID=2952536 RepID=UPI0020931493|nr:primosome assembly protein PriA [Actinoallomurus rhizosphaericola]MCO5996569.1 primosome assembly protein PriA [Actinoallomurus rhizosphaericola]